MDNPILVEERASARVMALIKIMDSKYLDSFCSGRIRMGTVRSYRECYEADGGGRNDPNENMGVIFQPDQVVIKINGITLEGLAAPIEIRPEVDDFSYLFCMTAITDRAVNAAGGVMKLSPELLKLGDVAVVVVNIAQFYAQLKAGIEAHGFLRSHANSDRRASGLVEYVDFEKHHGAVGPFRKSDKFAFQHEWRLSLIDSRLQSGSDHLFLDIGKLHRITQVMKTIDLIQSKISFLPKEES